MNDMIIWVLIGGAVVALAVGGYLLLLRARGGSKDESYLHFRCTGCKRRLRFRASQSGHSGQCSHCGRKLIFPAASQSTD